MRWLLDRIHEIQSGDPLRPVTVVVANHYVGLALRREFATKAYANVRFVRLASIAETFGAPVLASRGQRPLTDIENEAAIRESLRRSGEGFGAVRKHRAVVELLKQLFGEVRERGMSDDQLTEWSRASRVADAAFATFTAYRERLRERGLYDTTDLMGAAVDGLDGPMRWRLREVGHVVVYLPLRWWPVASAFVLALSRRTPMEIAFPAFEDALADAQAKKAGTALGLDWNALPETSAETGAPELGVVLAADPSGEVRSAVRKLAADLKAGVPLYRMAILYRREEPYAALVRETLDAAGLPWAALGGRPLADSVVGRGLIGLLRLREDNFARRAVLDWLSTLPHAGRAMPSFSDWNRISREAGVVRGEAGWKRGLERSISALDKRLADDPTSLGEAQKKYLEAERGRVAAVARAIESISADTAPPAETTWTALTEWALRCREMHVPDPTSGFERESGEAVDEVVRRLATAGTIEQRTDVPTFIDTLEAALRGALRPEGRLGTGVTVGTAASAVGMAFDRVHLVGLSEGVFPAPEPADPIFPEGDRLGRREERLGEERTSFLAAMAAADGGRVQLSAPLWDTQLRVTFAAPWLLEMSSGLAGRALTSGELRGLTGSAWLTRVESPSQSLETAPALLDIGEFHIEEARRTPGPGPLQRSGLARRADVPLGRNLEVQRARRSHDLTAFDGHVRSRPDQGLGRRPTSASAIQEWAACPFSYLMGRVLKVERTENPEDSESLSISPMLKGSLIHSILERFFRELHAEGRPRTDDAYTAADHDRLELIASGTFAEIEAAGQAGHALSWANERDSVLLDLHSTLTVDQEDRAGLVPARFEQAFGMDSSESWPPATVALSAGGEARIRGRIDRLDLPPDQPRPERALVLDYKSGSMADPKELAADPVVAGTQLQLAAYALATRRWLVEVMAAKGPSVDAAYWGVSAKEKFQRVGLTLDYRVEGRLRDALDIVDEGLRSGAFPQVPGDDTQRGTRASWDNCVYCPYTRICPSGRDLIWSSKRKDPASTLHGSLATDADGSE